MRKIVFLLACLACMVHGRRLPSASQQVQSKLLAYRKKPVKSEQQLKALGMLLASTDSSAAFSPTGLGVRSLVSDTSSSEPSMRHAVMPASRTRLAADIKMLSPFMYELFADNQIKITIASRDLVIAGGTAAASLAWSKCVGLMANKSMITPVIGRKLLHMTCGPGFLLAWPFFSNLASAQWVAAAVPVLSIMRLFRASFGVPSVSGLVRATSRSGSPKEVLGGPLYYTVTLLLATIFSFRSPIAAVAVSMMAVGDGIADVFGRRFGKTKWPFLKNKSVEGSAAFVVGGFAASLGMISQLHATGHTALTAASVAPAVLLIAFLSAAIELVPAKYMDDNLSVPGLSALLACALLK